LCKVTSAIAVGDTLAVGTNLALADNVVEQIYSLNQGLTNSLNNLSHENLLDNPWFTVNQRGQSSYGANTYSLDRWRSGNNNQVAISGNVVTLSPVNTSQSCVFFQVFEDEADGLNGKTVTLSLLDGSGNLYTVSHVVEHKTTWTQLFWKGFNDSFSIGLTAQPLTDGKYRYSFDINTYATKTLTIKAVKLELGSVSTLAQDTAPNYAEELLKCQRYYVRFKNSDNGLPLAFGYLFQGNSRVACPLSMPMRAKPSFKFTTSGSGGPTFTLASGEVATNISNFTIDTDDMHQRIIFLYPNITSGTNELAVLRLNTGVLLELSAEL
jgi:hypothetical protein